MKCSKCHLRIAKRLFLEKLLICEGLCYVVSCHQEERLRNPHIKRWRTLTIKVAIILRAADD